MARPAGGSATKKRQPKRSQLEHAEIQNLEKIISEGAPASGTNPLALEPDGSYASAREFDQLPLSKATKEGLHAAKYVTLTAIQRAALPHALAGRDVLGAAKTGSGKTLAFIIPVLERLYRAKWTRLDGLGAIIITPTRELALQIFEELRKVGKQHEFSAALLVGGKNVKEEKERVNQMNILVCTPGRLLQHMDETPGFDPTQLQILVLDEADRILDMGFATTLDAILENLPRKGRQTLLFSATQTKSVKDIARLSLTSPEYLSVHADASAPTPVKLQQLYVECELHQKMDVMWSFIKTHLKNKTIIFLSTCKQVRFIHEALRKLRPGIPLRGLHGNMKQMKRMAVFYEFCEAKAMVLVATDVAARGLDFPTLDWVLQMDCPEDVASYIHRVGRTARYLSGGRALLLLTPSEKPGMLAALEEAKIPIQPIKMNPNKTQPVGPALQALLSKNKELKDFAQGALTSYLRSVFLQPRKDIFDVTKLPVSEYAQSIGLLSAPRLRFLKRTGKKVTEINIGGANVPALEGPAAAGPQVDATKVSGKRSRKDRDEDDDNDENRPSTSKKAQPQTGDAERDGDDDYAGDDGDHDGDGTGGSEEEDSDVPPAKKPKKHGGIGGSLSAASSVLAGMKDAMEEEDDDGDFLVVKQRNVFDNENGIEKIDEGGAADGEADGKKKKKKKQKINPNRGTGQRQVFDDEGNAVEPLALLAASELGNGVDNDQDKDGLHVVRDNAEERFALARQQMRLRDARDKAQLKSLRKQKRAEKKAKRKQADMDGPVATLGGADDESYSEEESEEEQEAPKVHQPTSMTLVVREAEPEPAHFGMAVKRVADKIRKQQEQEIDELALEDKEALALKLLSAKRG